MTHPLKRAFFVPKTDWSVNFHILGNWKKIPFLRPAELFGIVCRHLDLRPHSASCDLFRDLLVCSWNSQDKQCWQSIRLVPPAKIPTCRTAGWI